MNNKILCIIPARCGSKGIRKKNIIDICGLPLIAYSIADACKLKQEGLISNVIVSTDCDEIANIAKKYGASVPFLRPDELSGDDAKSIDFILHAIDYFEQKGESCDSVLLLQPTSPIRGFDVLKASIDMFNESDEDSLISCYKEEYVNDLVMYHKDGALLKPLNKLHNKGVRRQEHGESYVRNGSIYLTKSNYLLETKQIISNTPLLIEMSKLDSINIDTLEDVEMLRDKLCK
jgi:CMP-N,N'-diacetyllegionaminic acid synthase